MLLSISIFGRVSMRLRDERTSPADRAAARCLTALQRQTVYLRIGLARGWDRHPDRCYLQITVVYGFESAGP